MKRLRTFLRVAAFLGLVVLVWYGRPRGAAPVPAISPPLIPAVEIIVPTIAPERITRGPHDWPIVAPPADAPTNTTIPAPPTVKV